MWRNHIRKCGILFEAFRCPVITNAFRVRETSNEAFFFLFLSRQKGNQQ